MFTSLVLKFTTVQKLPWSELLMFLELKDINKASILVPLDLRAVFDIADHTILFQCFEQYLGLSGTVLDYILICVRNISYSVSTNSAFSMESHKCQFLVLCFSICTCYHLGPSYNNTISHIILTVTTHKYTSLSLLIILAHWMASFSVLLTLNTGWQQTFYSGVRTKRDSLSRSQGSEAPDYPPFFKSSVGMNMPKTCVILDADQLSFRKHRDNISKTTFYHLRNISEVRCFLSLSDYEKLVYAFVSSRLHYCNALFAVLSKH